MRDDPPGTHSVHNAPDQHAYDIPYHWCMSNFYKYIVSEAVDRVADIVDGTLVLEMGCGDGFVTALLARHARQILGFDISERAIAFAKLIVQEPNVAFEVGSAGDVALFAGRFPDGPDVIASFESMEHLSESELGAFLSDSHNVLRERNGWLIVTTPNGGRRRDGKVNPHHALEFKPRELRQLLEDAGFADIEVSGLYLQPRWVRLEHFANTVPFRAGFRALARAGASRPEWCRTLLCRCRAR